jgi:hypothetical protein
LKYKGWTNIIGNIEVPQRSKRFALLTQVIHHQFSFRCSERNSSDGFGVAQTTDGQGLVMTNFFTAPDDQGKSKQGDEHL